MFVLKTKGPQIPLYEPLNVQIKSYDFTVLEKFSGYIHKTAENMGIEVDDWYATRLITSVLLYN